MRIIGIDPGLASTGWAIVEKSNQPTLIDYGCFKTKSGVDLSTRLQSIYKQTQKIIKRFSPKAMAIESLFFAQNITSAIKVAQAQGVIKLAGKQTGLSVFEYSPLNIKMAITGYGKADKTQVEFMVKQLLHLKTGIKPNHAADAVAVGLTHSFTNLKLKRK